MLEELCDRLLQCVRVELSQRIKVREPKETSSSQAVEKRVDNSQFRVSFLPIGRSFTCARFQCRNYLRKLEAKAFNLSFSFSSFSVLEENTPPAGCSRKERFARTSFRKQSRNFCRNLENSTLHIRHTKIFARRLMVCFLDRKKTSIILN